MKKILVLVLALVLALSCFTAMAEMKDEYNIHVLVWKFDDTYGSTVRQGMTKWAELVGEELGTKINLTMDDAQDDMAKQVEQADQIIGKKPDFVIINLAEPAGGQTLCMEDGFHMNEYGRYLLALVWIRTLCGESVQHNAFRPEETQEELLALLRSAAEKSC